MAKASQIIDALKGFNVEGGDQETPRAGAAIARNGRRARDVDGEVKLALKKDRVFIVSKKGLAVLR